jgi:hypothetical protein
MRTKRHEDKLGYNPNTIPQKPNTRYVVSEQSRELFEKVVGEKLTMQHVDELSKYDESLFKTMDKLGYNKSSYKLKG